MEQELISLGDTGDGDGLDLATYAQRASLHDAEGVFQVGALGVARQGQRVAAIIASGREI